MTTAGPSGGGVNIDRMDELLRDFKKSEMEREERRRREKEAYERLRRSEVSMMKDKMMYSDSLTVKASDFAGFNYGICVDSAGPTLTADSCLQSAPASSKHSYMHQDFPQHKEKLLEYRLKFKGLYKDGDCVICQAIKAGLLKQTPTKLNHYS